MLDKSTLEALNKIKYLLISKEVILSHPNFNTLTADGFNYALGCVLEQAVKLIKFRSRLLNKTERAMPQIKKKYLYAFVLRNYLYG